MNNEQGYTREQCEALANMVKGADERPPQRFDDASGVELYRPKQGEKMVVVGPDTTRRQAARDYKRIEHMGFEDAKAQIEEQGSFSSGLTWDDDPEANEAYDRGVNRAEVEHNKATDYKAHADKLAEALRAWEYAGSEGGISMVDWFEVARKKTREALAAYERDSQ